MTSIRSTQTVAQVAYTGQPKVRSTQTVVQAAYSDSGKIQATQVYIKIVYTPGSTVVEESVASDLSGILDQTVTINVVAAIALSDDISGIDHTVDVYINRRVGTTILVQQAVLLDTVIERSIEDVLNIGSSVLYTGSRAETFSNSLTFTQVARATRLLPVKEATSAIVIVDAADWSRPTLSVLNLLQLAEGRIGFLSDTASNALILTSQVEIATELVRSLSQGLTLTQTATKIADFPLSVTSTLSFVTDVYSFNTSEYNYVLLQAPVGAIEASIVLPNAEIGDTENIVSDMDLKIAMDGTKRTYLRTNSDRVLRYTFRMNRLRSLALLAFTEHLGAERMRLTNWKGEVWHVYLTTNPIEFVETQRGSLCGANTDVDLEFTGVKISG